MSTQNNQSSASAASATPSAATSTPLPALVSLDKWADVGFTWSGQVMPSDFTRLQSLLTEEHAQSAIGIEATLSRTSNVLGLGFSLAGEVWLTCQRCLQPVAVDLTGEHHIDLLDDEIQAKMLDDEDEYLLLEEVIEKEGHESYLPLARLIEDEILLKTPLSPKHDDCEMAVDQVGEIEETEEESPFAALAALKGKLSS